MIKGVSSPGFLHVASLAIGVGAPLLERQDFHRNIRSRRVSFACAVVQRTLPISAFAQFLDDLIMSDGAFQPHR